MCEGPETTGLLEPPMQNYPRVVTTNQSQDPLSRPLLAPVHLPPHAYRGLVNVLRAASKNEKR